MELHLRAALAECEARLASLAAETQRATEQRSLILRALERFDAATSAVVEFGRQFEALGRKVAVFGVFSRR